MTGKAAKQRHDDKLKRRRFPIGKLLGGESQTIESGCGPVVVGTEHKDGQWLVVVDVPKDVENDELG